MTDAARMFQPLSPDEKRFAEPAGGATSETCAVLSWEEVASVMLRHSGGPTRATKKPTKSPWRPRVAGNHGSSGWS